ncbi:MAG: dihydropteroate synthase [Acidobacteriaceae bacterium]|nr:dihydropteroate synthase [Acidobacteriaceae bacterium]
MPFAPRLRYQWKLRTCKLALGERTVLMGILNVTPDSFSDGGHFYSAGNPVETAVAHALGMLDEGADILDIGGESTRPGAAALTSGEEQDRILPVIEAIRTERPQAVLSVDTYHADTARRAVEAGVEIVNDVSGLLWDDGMAAACAKLGCGLVLMHTRGRPQEWASLPACNQESPDRVVSMVLDDLRRRLEAARSAGIEASHIALDPGFGFGKRLEENMPLLAHLERLHELGHPLVAGASRKGFLVHLAAHLHEGPLATGARLNLTTAANVAAILAGTHILRVHDLPAAAEAAAVADRILAM